MHLSWIAGVLIPLYSHSSQWISEPVEACVIPRYTPLTSGVRSHIAQCLGWQFDPTYPVCMGYYKPIEVSIPRDSNEIHIMADRVSLYKDTRSTLSGHVSIQQGQRIVEAQTAYVYRDAQTNKVEKIEFVGDVRYIEPDKLIIAQKAHLNPQDKSGTTEDVLYRFGLDFKKATQPAWGRAGFIERFANKDYLLRLATYTTCAPEDKAWELQAKSIYIDEAKAKGVARDVTLKIHDLPVVYTPYLSFPTNKERKSGFLMPIVGYSNVGGLDFATPYYWNMAPNYDLTLVPQVYSERGVMLGGEYRFLTPNSSGIFTGSILPQDRAFTHFLQNNQEQFPRLQGVSNTRWAYGILESTRFTPNFFLNVNVQQVSDDYYLQDFNTNLALITQRQLIRQADLTYVSDNWILRGMGQSYQTLEPINEIPITPVYERVPQLMARGFYYDLPLNANLNILGQYDQFNWPTRSWDNPNMFRPQGPRFHFNPVLSVPFMKPWGYVTPSVQFVENYYAVNNDWGLPNTEYNRTIPRYSLDSGLFFERTIHLNHSSFINTLEPRIYYLNVPFHDQTPIPVYDSGFMIFNVDQLFRTNRFSGFDRIGDANQLSYALTTRWLSEETGAEKANFSIGQIKYFSPRRVQLCQSVLGNCIDSPYLFANLSSRYPLSPVASRAVYHFNPAWGLTGDYIWDPSTNETNNADINIHYQPVPNAIINAGYSYLVNGDSTQARDAGTQDNSLNQAIVSFAWPLNERWSTVGAYSHNISKNYSMMNLLGVQYDTCCWAMRLVGGRSFKSLNAEFQPQYNNNVYLQILLKGLGSVANGDPYNILSTYIPGYNDPFRR